MKELCQKWKVKLIFRGAYRPSGTGTEKNHRTINRMAARSGGESPLDTVEVDLTDPDPDPSYIRQIYATAHRKGIRPVKIPALAIPKYPGGLLGNGPNLE